MRELLYQFEASQADVHSGQMVVRKGGIVYYKLRQGHRDFIVRAAKIEDVSVRLTLVPTRKDR